ncbi:hypothetical protein [Melittangium boletus]|uniref:Lipoprotein n=1 Tax=Melittangium boletus DSM 14713 TaxID=1294270 RepID=A0A250IL49_9BACT|nr:hypothetical protein [Melittangium boletus]ATB31940.1 hypothetical protein MEBOL_005412 [Melittangium boletus DSM 14713]
MQVLPTMTVVKRGCGWVALALSGLLMACTPEPTEKPDCETAPDSEECSKPPPPDAKYKLSLDGEMATYKAGGDIKVSWSAPEDHPESDWVGLFPEDNLESSHLTRQNVPAGSSGTLTFSAPSRSGKYALRYITGSGNVAKEVGSKSFSVEVPPTHIFLFSNDAGGDYTLVVDQDLPNIQIGILSRRPTRVKLAGAYVGNVSAVRLVSEAFQESTVEGVTASRIQRVPSESVTVTQPYTPPTLVCTTGDRVLLSRNGCNSTTQVEEYFLSKFGEVQVLSHVSKESEFSGSIELSKARMNLVLVRDAERFDVAAALGSPAGAVDIVVDVNATVGSSAPGIPALTTGNLAEGSTVRINNYASIVGAGGAGGSGGNGAKGSYEHTCSRNGFPGGAAIHLTAPTTLDNKGNIWGGGGGGGGGSGEGFSVGGGGGAGFAGGAGGVKVSPLSEREEIAYCGADNRKLLRESAPGGAGSNLAGGEGGKVGDLEKTDSFALVAGNGGGYGQPGGSPKGQVIASRGGAAGAAIKRNGHRVNLPDGPLPDAAYDIGFGPLRGPIEP